MKLCKGAPQVNFGDLECEECHKSDMLAAKWAECRYWDEECIAIDAICERCGDMLAQRVFVNRSLCPYPNKMRFDARFRKGSQ